FLVNKSHNKTSYELFNGRSPAIGFLKPFGCHVMILNTLDNLGKFEEKGDEDYFIGYSMSSKAFRVINKRTKRVEENFHVEFLENKTIKKGSGPNWLFDINSLTKSMNYVPVDAGTISTNLSGSRNPNPTASTSNPPADQMEILTVETPIHTVSSPVPTAYSTDSQEPSSDARLISKRVANQVETPSLDNILSLTNRFEDILGVTTNLDESNGVEADISNMETAITATYSDSDYGGASQDRKSTTRGSQFLAASCCGQILWIQNQLLDYGRTRIAQSSVLPTVAEELASSLRDVSQGEACPTDSGFIADQDRATIDKSSTLPHDSAPRVTSYVADKGSMQQTIPELTALCTSLQRQLSELTAKFQAQERRSMDEGEAATKRISDDSEEIATVLTSMDAATVLASGVVDVPTGSEFIPTAKCQQQDFKILNVSKVFDDMSKDESVWSNTTYSVQVLEDRESVAAKHSGDDAPIKGRSINEGEAVAERISNESDEIARVWTSMDAATVLAGGIDVPTGSGFIPTAGPPSTDISTGSEVAPTASPIVTASLIEETERLKRKGLNLEQEHVKKQKSSEEAPEIEKSTKEIPEEKMKEMMQLVPVEDIYVQALQVKHLIIDWKGRIVGNKMHKAFPLLIRKFPLPEGTSHCLKMNATIRRIEMPLLEVCTAVEEKKKKLPVKDRWQLH
nr:ribonuclease H-like domain-containing protein [Tanacetum cinerariifolium]